MKLLIALLIINLIFITGCKDKPKQVVEFWTAKHIYIGYIPALRITVKNNSNKDVHDVYCVATAKDSNGKQLDMMIVSFNNSGKLGKWEIATDIGIFPLLKSHNDWADIDFVVGYELG